MHFISLSLAILIGVAGQIFLKTGALHMNSIRAAKAETARLNSINNSFFNNLLEYLLNFDLWLGLFFYGLSTLFYIFALQKIPLSLAYPSISISYIFVLILSNLIFKETIATQQILGVALIIIGVSFLWKS